MYYFIRVMLPITFDYFLITFQNFLQMFSAVNNFKMLKIGSVKDSDILNYLSQCCHRAARTTVTGSFLTS